MLQRMKSPKEDYEIRKGVVSDLGTREDQLNYLSFYTLVIYHVIISRSNKCTSKVVTPDIKRTMVHGQKHSFLVRNSPRIGQEWQSQA